MFVKGLGTGELGSSGVRDLGIRNPKIRISGSASAVEWGKERPVTG